MTSIDSMSVLPYNNMEVSEISNLLDETIHTQLGVEGDIDHVQPTNNNDFLSNIDPDVNNNITKKCKYYNIPDFNQAVDTLSNVSIIVLNIRSSNKNLQKFIYYDSGIKMKWTFIKITENWGKPNTIIDQNIPGYKHAYYIRQKNGWRLQPVC